MKRLSKDQAVRKVEKAIDALASLQDGGYGAYDNDHILDKLNALRHRIEMEAAS